MSQWIKCSERLPEPGENVIACWGSTCGEAFMGETGLWYRNGCDVNIWLGSSVTHWLPMPEPPKGDDDE